MPVGDRRRDSGGAGSIRLRYALHAADKRHPDLQRTKNLRAVQLLLGHSKLESSVRCLGIELDYALEISEQIEI